MYLEISFCNLGLNKNLNVVFKEENYQFEYVLKTITLLIKDQQNINTIFIKK